MRNALIVRGGWDGHMPVETTNSFIPFLEANGFTVRVEESPEVYTDAEYMATVDLIVQINTMTTITKEQFAGLQDAILAGTGMAGWHGGIADSYRDTADYLHMIGGQFAHHAGKPPEERTGEQSDNYIPYTVHITELGRTHPITEGIADFDLVTEQYWVLSDEYNDVLATTTQEARPWDAWNRAVTAPAIWTRQWGKGRIFVSAPGHRIEITDDPNVHTIIERGTPVGSPLTFGIIGVGKISEQYFASLPSLPGLRLVAVADMNEARAAEVAAEQGVAAMTVDELLDAPGIDAVLNLTIPAAHVDIDTRALEAGKHVFAEKPLGLTVAESEGMLALADSRGLRIGSAPDTVLGTGVQTARAALDAGMIGDAVGASAFWTAPGHEAWHPAPLFYYQPGGGPLFDMGPYYLTSLVSLLGPVVRVSGTVGRSNRERVVETGALAGTPIPVEVDTHISAILEHRSGVSSTVTMSFEVWATRTPCLEVYGTAGTIAVPDPNRFSDPVQVFTSSEREWTTIETLAGYEGAGRGYGLADLAHAIETDRPHRASGELAFHVLEIMESILVAGAEHRVVELRSTVERPDVVPLGAAPDTW